MTDISKTLHRLLDKAGLEPEDVPDTSEGCREAMELLHVEIDEIKGQLDGEKAGLTSFSVQDHTWWNRANHALAMKKAQYGAMKRRRNQLVGIEEGEKKRRHTQRQREQEEAADRRRAERQKAHAQRMATESELQMTAIKPLIRELPPETRETFYATMQAATEEVRRD